MKKKSGINFMKPIDIRNETWESIQSRIECDRKSVWLAYKQYGPCTTRELARKMDLTIFTVRPRTTELLDMFLVELTGRNREGGIYSHVPAHIAKARYEATREKILADQMELFK